MAGDLDNIELKMANQRSCAIVLTKTSLVSIQSFNFSLKAPTFNKAIGEIATLLFPLQ